MPRGVSWLRGRGRQTHGLPRSWLVLSALVLALAVTAAVLVGRLVASGVAPSSARPAGRPTARAVVPAATPRSSPALVSFRDARTGLSIGYPATWTHLVSPQRSVVLVAARGEAASLLLRVVPLGIEVTSATLPRVKALTDRLVRSGQGVKLLAASKAIELGGLPGYFYLYSFRDARTRQRGIHSHYFLFAGQTLITLVFQALPEARFERFAPVFDRIAGSFRAATP